jgi:hypothetical protein
MIAPSVALGSLEGKKPFLRHRYRWEDNIIMIFHEISYEVGLERAVSNMDPWSADVNSVTKLRIV